MRILVALPYGPSRTRVRSRMLLRELARRHDVTLLGLAWDQDDVDSLETWRPQGVEVHIVRHGRLDRVRALLGGPRRPLQEIASTSDTFAAIARGLIDQAAARGRPFDAVHVEHFRGAAAMRLDPQLGCRTVYDAVDCIAELARQAAAASPSQLVKLVARYEIERTRRREAFYVASAAATTVVAERDRQALRDAAPRAHIEVIPNGVALHQKPIVLTDQPVAIFTGKLSYHANQAAIRLLLNEIWPRVRLVVPEARLVIAGAEPPEWLSRAAGRDGVELLANPESLEPSLARARVALAPMVYSVGIQNKVLEAMACGVPVVATSSAAEGLLPASERTLLVVDKVPEFADATIRLMADPDLARELGAAGYAYVARFHQWSAAADRFERLYASLQPERETASSCKYLALNA